MSEYPNIEALAEGRVSGQFSERPEMRIEAARLLANYGILEAENERLKDLLREAESMFPHKCGHPDYGGCKVSECLRCRIKKLLKE